MMNYETAKDWELNVAVAKSLGYDAMPVQFHESAVAAVYIKNGVPRGGLNQKDFCNSWSDAGPIIEKYKISFKNDYDEFKRWVAYHPYYGNGERHENPLRAAMLVFLKMKIAEDICQK